MRNNAPGGNGNDLGLDDITFRPAGPSIQVGISGYTETELVVCREDNRTFQFNAVVDPCYIASDYQWQLSRDSGRSWVNIQGATGTGYTRTPVSAPGTYWYRIAVAQRGNIGISNCRTVSTPIKIYTPPIPDPQLGPDTYLCKGDSLLLQPGAFDTYRWQDGSTLPNFQVRQGGLYSVTVGNVCESVNASVQVTERVCDLFFPTAFTPNGDGKNDMFRLLSSYALETYDLRIFNRWGQEVFHTRNEQEGWDGKLRGQEAPDGLYVWTCTAKLSGSGKMLVKKGTVNLIH
jgi:gliding motility-associated-like protein